MRTSLLLSPSVNSMRQCPKRGSLLPDWEVSPNESDGRFVRYKDLPRPNLVRTDHVKPPALPICRAWHRDDIPGGATATDQRACDAQAGRGPDRGPHADYPVRAP